MSFAFSPEQQEVLTALEAGTENLLITGVAGCGKSTILRTYLDSLRKNGKLGSVLITAPTGIAALNIGGITIHRAFGLSPNFDPLTTDPFVRRDVYSNLLNVETVVVDEVSMVRGDLFNMMDIIMRSMFNKNKTFGGKRLILVGDLYQLPPIVKNEERSFLLEHFGSAKGWFFKSPAYEFMKPKMFFLKKSYRQADSGFVDLLNRIRNSDRAAVRDINKFARSAQEAPKEAPFLCNYKFDVTQRNVGEMAALKQPIAALKPTTKGDVTLAPKELMEPIRICKGARAMTTRNCGSFVNGTLGTITDINELGIYFLPDGEFVDVRIPEVEFDVVNLQRDENNKLKYTKVGGVVQFPVTLAWAITTHKSQGQGFKQAVLDMGKGAFAHGQLYVALSRLTNPEGLYLHRKLMPADVIVDQDVVEFCSDV